MQQILDCSRQITASLALALCVLSCARQGAPTGGPKDLTPPKLDSIASTPNFTTRFDKKRIELRFDEWIVLEDAVNQVIISPPLNKRPKITLKGKMVVVELPEEEVLRENTTYTINFGKAVKDLHESNAATNLRFIFSTGDFIDSLSVAGSVVDAFSGDQVDNITVMLYDIFTDSVARKERPYYFSRTDKSGQFTLENLKEGTYKAVAIEDTDQNLKWSGEGERIAFMDSLLTVGDSQKQILQLRIFKEQPRFRLFDRNANRYGLAKLVYTSAPDSVQLRVEQPGLRFLTEKSADTLLVWYDLPDSTAWQLFANADTVPVKALNRTDFLKKNRILFADDIPVGGGNSRGDKLRRGQAPAAPPVSTTPPPKTVVQTQSKPAGLMWKTPMAAFDTSRWQLTVDSTRNYNFTVSKDSTAPRRLLLDVRWLPGKSYSLVLLPGAVTDFYGVSNTDTIQRVFSIPTDKQLGGLNLNIEELKPGKKYVVQLLNGTVVDVERSFLAETAAKKIVFSGLPTATYSVVLIEDENGNGRWDTGNYFGHLQPERIFTKKLEALRANWEVEATIRAISSAAEKKLKQ
ncbi:MAG: Ig-like domain-containing protein [Saprospiraceae bacterium]|nr:Ig-like domain-containing protein [Saprospiraceae bacterium]